MGGTKGACQLAKRQLHVEQRVRVSWPKGNYMLNKGRWWVLEGHPWVGKGQLRGHFR